MADLISRVEELASLLDEHKLVAIKVKEGDVAIELRREALGSRLQVGSVAREGSEPQGPILPSPMVGVFYRRPTPGEAPFIEVGDRVSVGQVVGIIEAMKVFNEIESPVAGVVVHCVVEEGAVVQEGEALFILAG
ncbi:MAG: acetyl-CoA carboxylase, biotin carboxyl carrier protein [Armatimonadetes bacterium]|nr:acetyl-CoA carboxylase, biotin carboxyl carrier protein [Armatimonadota bacterium]